MTVYITHLLELIYQSSQIMLNIVQSVTSEPFVSVACS